jgi:hypothetical protein
MQYANIYSMPNFEQGFIPYETSARHIVLSENSTHETFIKSLMPEITDQQVQCFLEYLVGAVHDGIITGLAMKEEDDPLDIISAYQLGVKDGLDRRQDEF